MPAGSKKSLEICGIGRVAADAAGELAAKSLETKSELDAARWQAALLKSDDPRARAVGLYIDSRFDGHQVRAALSEPAIDSLVQLSAETHDPAVYAIALAACTHQLGSTPADTQPASCGLISATGWTTLDPDNAASWLTLAGIARNAKDLAGENAAFAQAAKATTIDGYNWSLLGFAEPEMPRDLNPLERYSLSIQMVGIESAMSSMTLHTASTHCSADAVRDEQTQAQCARLAEVLVSKGTTMLDLAIGTAIGARVGWPKSRIAELTEQKEAFMQARIQQSQSDKDENALTCATAARHNVFFHDWAQLGELGADRELINRSGESVVELAQKHRDFLNNLQHPSP